MPPKKAPSSEEAPKKAAPRKTVPKKAAPEKAIPPAEPIEPGVTIAEPATLDSAASVEPLAAPASAELPAPAPEPWTPAPIAPVVAPAPPIAPSPFLQAVPKPGKVQAIAIMTLVSGILNCLWGFSAGVSIFAANFFACYWAPYAITLGVLEIIYAAKLLGSNPRVQPATYLAIMQIINITTLNVYQLFIGDVVVGILALVFYSDPEVKAYFARINGQV